MHDDRQLSLAILLQVEPFNEKVVLISLKRFSVQNTLPSENM